MKFNAISGQKTDFDGRQFLQQISVVADSVALVKLYLLGVTTQVLFKHDSKFGFAVVDQETGRPWCSPWLSSPRRLVLPIAPQCLALSAIPKVIQGFVSDRLMR
ncbi:hypothetical protein [Pseudomonas viridiflava]|uniref:hypothetical protein n=1 Tax=Pseudomonas viridiflava TaxID=33069 RepID=UPI002EA62C61|nr:hypothetical protein [Pseudomonas viridiflava]